MLMIAVGLNCLAALLLIALAGKYLLGPAPADYHEEVLREAGADISSAHKGVFRAVNFVIGSGFLAQAILILLVTYFGVMQDILWAKVTVLVAAVVAGLPPTIAAQQMEKRTRVRTPWRPGIGLMVIVIAAFVLSVI